MGKGYHKNVPGDFYVEDQCCIICGIPTQEAPDLFRFEENSAGDKHCYVYRQPTTTPELARMMDVMVYSEVGCIRYNGNDPALLSRMREQGMLELCDHASDFEAVHGVPSKSSEMNGFRIWLDSIVVGFRLLWQKWK